MRFVFEGVVGISYQGDIVLDDIILNQGLCLGLSICDFEDGMCGYIQDVSDQFNWILYFLGIISMGIGLISDYIYGIR